METKIKTTWTTDDISAGMYIVRTDADIIEDTGYLTTITYKIGWHLTVSKDNNGLRKYDYCLLSMADGMVYCEHPRDEMAKFLNSRGRDKKGNYRKATKSELIRIVEYQNQ